MLHSRAPLRIKVSDVGPTLIFRVDDNCMPRKQWKKASGYHRQGRVENTFLPIQVHHRKVRVKPPHPRRVFMQQRRSPPPSSSD